ncbi:MAG TPA: radical SAM protein [Thermoanaerobaculia bacterium]|nr:radical SAM protein [Thermoanaerobaculia bacterium]
MLRTSRYTIYVDLPGNDRDVLLFHGYTGACDKVSRPIADFLRRRQGAPAKPLYGDWSAEAGGAADGAPAEGTIEVLREQGYLTPLSPEEEETFFTRLVEQLHARALAQRPSYIFMPTYDCNLRCSYCYQDSLRTGCGAKELLRSMRPAMVDRIFAAMPKIEARHGLDPAAPLRRSVGLFGGEPLLAANRPVVEHILRRAREGEGADVWAVTNGTELPAYRDLLGPAGISRVQITLDGTPEEHDTRRVYADGSGSYARIAESIALALELGAAVSLRINVDRKNLGDLPAIAREILRRGWHRSERFSAYTAPVRAGNGKTDAAGTLSTAELDQALTMLRACEPEVALLGRPDEGLRGRARRLFAGGAVLPSLRPSFCSAHDQMYIFDPFGDIYTCWERTGDRDVRLGSVTPEGDVAFRFDHLQLWRSRTVASNPVCRRCRYALHCGGGCAVLALERNQQLHSNHCDGFARRFRDSVAEAYLEHTAGITAGAVPATLCES